MPPSAPLISSAVVTALSLLSPTCHRCAPHKRVPAMTHYHLSIAQNRFPDHRQQGTPAREGHGRGPSRKWGMSPHMYRTRPNLPELLAAIRTGMTCSGSRAVPSAPEAGGGLSSQSAGRHGCNVLRQRPQLPGLIMIRDLPKRSPMPLRDAKALPDDKTRRISGQFTSKVMFDTSRGWPAKEMSRRS